MGRHLPLFENLKSRSVHKPSDIESWLKDRSELDAFLEENMAWRYIKMTIDTTDEALSNDYSDFIKNIAPKMAPEEDALNKKMMSFDGIEELEKNSAYKIYIHSVRSSIALYREENIPLSTEVQELAKEYGAIMARPKH